VNEVMPKLKKLAQQFGIRVIILSQMSRASKREQQLGSLGGYSKGGGIVEEMIHSEIELFKDVAINNQVSPIIATVSKNRRGPSGYSYRLG
jgi:replicative DNA helicase